MAGAGCGERDNLRLVFGIFYEQVVRVMRWKLQGGGDFLPTIDTK
jgi:hypothetical protein